jgi:hypothetical protein
VQKKKKKDNDSYISFDRFQNYSFWRE